MGVSRGGDTQKGNKKMIYRTGCFAFKRDQNGCAMCAALKVDDCVGCAFYKPKAKEEKEIERFGGNIHDTKKGVSNGNNQTK